MVSVPPEMLVVTVIGFRRLRHELSRFRPYKAAFRRSEWSTWAGLNQNDNPVGISGLNQNNNNPIGNPNLSNTYRINDVKRMIIKEQYIIFYLGKIWLIGESYLRLKK